MGRGRLRWAYRPDPQAPKAGLNRSESAVAVCPGKQLGCILDRTGMRICHAHKSRHHCSFGVCGRWRRLFPPLASIHGQLGTTKLSALRADTILKFVRSAFKISGRI
jgi:hypothetical protein